MNKSSWTTILIIRQSLQSFITSLTGGWTKRHISACMIMSRIPSTATPRANVHRSFLSSCRNFRSRSLHRWSLSVGIACFPGNDSGTDTSARSSSCPLIKPSQSTLESPCSFSGSMSISWAPTGWAVAASAPRVVSPCCSILSLCPFPPFLRSSPKLEKAQSSGRTA